jgi:hypothetical protein
MSQTATATGPTIHARTSRLWAMCKLRFTEFVFPSHLSADQLGITLVKVESWFTPWTRQDEHLPMSHLAEVTHQRGLIWDTSASKAAAASIPCRSKACRKAPPMLSSPRSATG